MERSSQGDATKQMKKRKLLGVKGRGDLKRVRAAGKLQRSGKTFEGLGTTSASLELTLMCWATLTPVLVSSSHNVSRMSGSKLRRT